MKTQKKEQRSMLGPVCHNTLFCNPVLVDPRKSSASWSPIN